MPLGVELPAVVHGPGTITQHKVKVLAGSGRLVRVEASAVAVIRAPKNVVRSSAAAFRGGAEPRPKGDVETAPTGRHHAAEVAVVAVGVPVPAARLGEGDHLGEAVALSCRAAWRLRKSSLLGVEQVESLSHVRRPGVLHLPPADGVVPVLKRPAVGRYRAGATEQGVQRRIAFRGRASCQRRDRRAIERLVEDGKVRHGHARSVSVVVVDTVVGVGRRGEPTVEQEPNLGRRGCPPVGATAALQTAIHVELRAPGTRALLGGESHCNVRPSWDARS
mmetsp:Transcript_16870/g.64027  ORF Transcript_16870/g.64027 Transcript_16870/m.64027 type:complete len:277 (+) Transcript_16870:3569-4399(+)